MDYESIERGTKLCCVQIIRAHKYNLSFAFKAVNEDDTVFSPRYREYKEEFVSSHVLLLFLFPLISLK